MKQKYKVIDKLIENKNEIPIYDARPFLVTKPDSWNRVYIFPFDTLDSSPTAKRYSGNSYGRIEWNIEPRKYKWDKSEKRYYITQLLLWTHQTRDLAYTDKIFGIDCMVESLCGTTHPIHDYEVGMLNNMWRMTPSSVTKTPMFACYPPDEFDLLEIDVTSSMSCEPKFQCFNKMPMTESHYEETKKLRNKPKEYRE